MSKIPKDHTSDLIVNLPYRAASGAVHLMGNFAPAERTPGYSSGSEHHTACGVGGGKQLEIALTGAGSQRGWEGGDTRNELGLRSCGA